MFRKPKFPIIGDIDGFLICGRNERQLYKNLERSAPSIEDRYDLFDANGDVWTLELEHVSISPAVLKRRWTKMRLIESFNSSQNAKIISQQYPTKSLSSKKLGKIFQDILELVEISLKNRST
jgi:hypothetical protein